MSDFVAVEFEASADAAERWVDALLAAGAASVDAADAKAGTAAEQPLYGEPRVQTWLHTRLTAIVDATVDAKRMLARAARIAGEPVPIYSMASIPRCDWVRKTQAQFAPIRVSERLWIVPTWCAPPDPQALVVRLDPGLAFGTGTHPTTMLCLRWLAANLKPGWSVLDYGCGSGILAIAAARLGAGRVAGVDIDPQAIEASRANAEANAVGVEFGLPDEIAHQSFDVVVANILAGPLELLAPLFGSCVREGGQLVLSGVLESQTDAVLGACARWFNIGPWGTMDGWVALAGLRGAR